MLGLLPPYLAQQDAHLVSPAAFVERRHSDPQVELGVVHPHIPAVNAAAWKEQQAKSDKLFVFDLHFN